MEEKKSNINVIPEIPTWLIQEFNLSITEAAIYVILFELQNKDWYYQDLANSLNITKKTVYRIIHHLESLGLVSIKETAEKKGFKNIIIPLYNRKID